MLSKPDPEPDSPPDPDISPEPEDSSNSTELSIDLNTFCAVVLILCSFVLAMLVFCLKKNPGGMYGYFVAGEACAMIG